MIKWIARRLSALNAWFDKEQSRRINMQTFSEVRNNDALEKLNKSRHLWHWQAGMLTHNHMRVLVVTDANIPILKCIDMYGSPNSIVEIDSRLTLPDLDDLTTSACFYAQAKRLVSSFDHLGYASLNAILEFHEYTI